MGVLTEKRAPGKWFGSFEFLEEARQGWRGQR